MKFMKLLITQNDLKCVQFSWILWKHSINYGTKAWFLNSHGLGESAAYGFQTLAKGAVPLYSVNIMKFYRHDQDSNLDRCGENQTC